MELQLVSQEQANSLKIAGFNGRCSDYWMYSGGEWQIFTGENRDYNRRLSSPQTYSRPTVALAIKWLRDVKDVDINILRYNPVMTEDKAYSVTIIHNAEHIKLPELYRGEKSYKAAESAGLDAALEYLTKQK